MSVYKGQWPEKEPFTEADIHVTIDGQPLPPAEFEAPGGGLTYGWGNFSPRAGKKLLAYSILLYELHNVMGLPNSTVHRYLIDIVDAFMDDMITPLNKQWSMTGDDVDKWLKAKYPNFWQEMTGHHAPA